MKKPTSLLFFLLFTPTIWAAPLEPTFGPAEVPQPTQQFVMADPQDEPQTVQSAPSTETPDTQSSSLESSLPPPDPALTLALTATPQAAPTNTATALGLNAPKQNSTENVLAGGLDIPSFMQCKQIYMSQCRNQDDPTKLEACTKKIIQPHCKPFLAFAKATSMSPKDDVDVIKHYKQLNLIHVTRFGANYPGVYYTLGTNGTLVDLIFGPQTQVLDIRKDLHYPEIVTRYPKVMLFSIVDKLPKTEPTEDGKGIRLILRFQLLNGCHACEQAGYANVAYDFSESGTLLSTSIQSMEPLF